MRVSTILCLFLSACSSAASPPTGQTTISSPPIPNPPAVHHNEEPQTIEQRFDEIEATIKRLDEKLKAKE